MNVTSIFLDPRSLENTGGCYGVVTSRTDTMVAQERFPEEYLSKAELIDGLQARLNNEAEALAELPDDADRREVTARWRLLRDLLNDLCAI